MVVKFSQTRKTLFTFEEIKAVYYSGNAIIGQHVQFHLLFKLVSQTPQNQTRSSIVVGFFYVK